MHVKKTKFDLKLGPINVEPERSVDGALLGARYTLFRIDGHTAAFCNVRDLLASGEKLDTVYKENDEIVEAGYAIELWQDLGTTKYWWVKMEHLENGF